MNTADYCPRGQELYMEWIAWKECIPSSMRQWLKLKEIAAYQRYRQHVDECDICKQKEE